MKRIYVALLGVVLIHETGQAQGFVNLNFESANVSGYSPGSDIPVTSALPGWSVYYNTTPVSEIVYDGISTGGAEVSLVDTNAVLQTLGGKYSVYLFGGGSLDSDSVSIAQTGLVPNGTESLTFDALVYGASFSVTLGGQTISMEPLETFSNYTLYGGNIPSGMAGQMETLNFTMPPPANSPPSMFELDNIQFSPAVVPEPNTLGLSALGGLFLAWRYRQIFFKTKA